MIFQVVFSVGQFADLPLARSEVRKRLYGRLRREGIRRNFTYDLEHYRDQLRGFYLAKSATRTYAVTQFQSTNARRAFPSFDEPAFKATFSIALTVDSSATVISTMVSRAVMRKPYATPAPAATRVPRHSPPSGAARGDFAR